MGKINKSKTIAVVDIELDKLRKLKYTNGALRKFQEKTDRKALKLKPDEFAEYATELIWCGLLHQDKELSIDDVDEMIGPSNIHYVMEKISEAWGMAMTEHKEPVEGNADPLPENLPT